MVVVENLIAFKAAYQDETIPIAGEYKGRLSNGGEHITLSFGNGLPILDFTYDDEWFATTDGDGFSLTVVDPASDPGQLGEKSSWTPSPFSDGSPGQ